MDRRRAAGALLALAACIACSAAAPTASNHTALDLYEGSSEGCYYNFQHYGEGDRIMTNEPCLNCTCHNRMLMCYLRVCPFTKAIGQDCTVEKRADQCCPIVTCPDVPVDLLTSTSTTSPAEYGATGLGKLDKYGCSINGKYFPEGSKVPPTPNKPCEHCYCIRNMTTCVMQECTLHVDGCTPIYHKDVCCPVRYSCDHPEDEMLLLDDMSTTVRPTPGFLLTTTTVSPVTQMTQDCVHNDQVISDGASITTEKACEHCYCMKGDIVCVVQECGAPMENEGKNCTSLPPREGQCCPDTYICEGDEFSTESATASTTDVTQGVLTTLSPPRRGGVEGSGYRIEPSESGVTVPSTVETELEGSGEEQEPTQSTDADGILFPDKTIEPEVISPDVEDANQYIPVTTKAPTAMEPETTTKQIDRNAMPEQETVEPDTYESTTHKTIHSTELTPDEHLKPHDHVTISSTPESYEKATTEAGESLNTVPDNAPAKEHEKPNEYDFTTARTPDESGTTIPQITDEAKVTPSEIEPDSTKIPYKLNVSESESLTPSSEMSVDITTEKTIVENELATEKEGAEPGKYPVGETGQEESQTDAPKVTDDLSSGEKSTEKESSTPMLDIISSTISPVSDTEKLTTEPDHEQNTVADNEEGYVYPRPTQEETRKSTPSEEEPAATEKITKATQESYTQATSISANEEIEKTTAEPDKGLNTIPSEVDEQSSSQPSVIDKTDFSGETKMTESSVIVDTTEPQGIDIISTTSSEFSTSISETHITKADQYTVTTEPSFRKEDEASITTDKPKEELASTTIKPEFVDEGLIPTSTHDDKLSTGSDVSILDENITTAMPEYVEETVESKKPTESPAVSETLPDRVTELTSEQESGLTSTTEKTMYGMVSTAATEFLGDVDEPSRIPGEGDCLLNGVTYRNNTIVPSSNNCQTGCKCFSSIIKCDPIICMPPPENMVNCQSIYDTPDSCCPTYVCDHPKETIPPQSDNQMSGTEPPSPPSVIECRGDQCELSVPTKEPAEPSEPCTTSDCLLPASQKPDTSECGPEGCSSAREPVVTQQPLETSECTDSECKSPQSPSTSSVSPVKTCEGEDCKVLSEQNPESQLCENEKDCKKVDLPVTQSDSCNESSDSDCGSKIDKPAQDNLQMPCREEEGCKPAEIPTLDCTGDLPCRRKDVPGAEELPSKCEGGDCMEKVDTSTYVTQDVHQLSTESSIPEVPLDEITEKIVPIEDEKLSKPEQEVSTEVTSVAEDHANTEPSTILPEPDVDKTTKMPGTVDDNTGKPLADGDEGTKSPELVEKHTDKPDLVEYDSTKTPENTKEDTPALPEEEVTEAPDVTEKDIDKSTLDEKEGTKIPDTTQQDTDKPALTEVEGTKMPDIVEEHTQMPALAEDEGTKSSEFSEEHTKMPSLDENTKLPDFMEVPTKKPIIPEAAATNVPNITQDYTDQPPLVEEGIKEDEITRDTDKPDEITKIPDLVEKEGTQAPTVADKGTSKPIEEASTHIPEITQEHTDKPALVDIEGTEIPKISKEHTDKPLVIDAEDTEIPNVTEESTAKPELIEREGTQVPDVTDEHTDKPGLGEEEDTKITETFQQHTDKPAFIDEQSTFIPEEHDKESTNKPELIEGEEVNVTETPNEKTDLPALESVDLIKTPGVGEEHTDKPAVDEDTGTKIPVVTESYTNKPIVTDENRTEIPEIAEEHTDKTISIEPDVVTDMATIAEEENKEKPILVEEDLPEKPIVTKDDSQNKPDLIDRESTSEPAISEVEGTEYPQVIEDAQTKKPILIEDDSVTASEIDDKDKRPIVTDSKTGEQIPLTEEGTEKPSVPEKDLTTVFADKEQETSEQPEHLPQTPSYDSTRRTDGPIQVTEPKAEVTSQTPVEEHTIVVSTEQDRTTKATIDEQQTTPLEDIPHIESGLEPTDVTKPEDESTDEGSVTHVTESQDVTQSVTGQEKTTKAPLTDTVSEQTLPPLREGEPGIDQTPEYVTASQISTIAQDASKMPELSVTTESIEKRTTKAPEPETITEEGEIYTDMPERESSVTKSPEGIIIEPQEGRPSEFPELPVTSEVFDQTTIKVYGKDKPDPESHFTEPVQNFESSSPTTEPEVSRTTIIPESIDAETQKTDEPEVHKVEAEKTPTSEDLGEQEIKPSQPEIFTPEKEEMITSTEFSAVTEPVSKFTEIEDAFATRKDYESTERFEPPTTEKIKESSEPGISSSVTPFMLDTTKKPTKYENDDVFTEIPGLKETKPDEIDVSRPDTTESSEFSQKTPVSGEQTTVIPDIITKTPDTTELKVTVTSAPVEEIIMHDEKTTTTPAIHESHVSESEQPEQPSPTESEDILKTTKHPEITGEPEVITQIPELPVTLPEVIDMKLEQEDKEKPSTDHPSTASFDEIRTELPHAQVSTEPSMSLVTESSPDVSVSTDSTTSSLESQEQITDKPSDIVVLPDVTTHKQLDEVTKSADQPSTPAAFSETTPYLIELEEHTHKIVDDTSMISSTEPDFTTPPGTQEEHTTKTQDHAATEPSSIDKVSDDVSAISPSIDALSTVKPEPNVPERRPEEEGETSTKLTEISTKPSAELTTIAGSVEYQTTESIPEETSEKLPEISTPPETPSAEKTTTVLPANNTENIVQADVTTSKTTQDYEGTSPTIVDESQKLPVTESHMTIPTEKESLATEKPLYPTEVSRKTTVPEEEVILTSTKSTPSKQEEVITPGFEDKFDKPEEKPTSEVVPPTTTTTTDLPKPPTEMQPTDETTGEDGQFPPSGYGEPDYVEEDQAFGPGTCRYGGKVYVSAQQIPRDDPCDFCFCFRSDIICLQQSCPPPIHGCHEEPIQGFCCPRYECPVSMATTVNVTTTTTTTTTTLPPHFPTHSYKGAAQRRGCQIKGHTYKVGEVVRSSSGPCLHCTCGGDGQMKCDPKACTPEPMLRQMIAAAVSAKRRR